MKVFFEVSDSRSLSKRSINTQVFGRAVHSLSKIGDELYLEPLEDGLALRTVNSSRSAYACFVFAPGFFLQYIDSIPTADSEEDVLKCKIGMKSCLTVFRSLSTLEKTVDKCKILFDMKQSRLIFQLFCRHGIMKTYNLSFIECETLQAVFSKELTPNVLTAQSRLFSDAVVNFQNNQEEVSLIVSPEKVSIKNYIEDEPDPQKVIRTELSMEPDEFDHYQVGVDTEVTFCLKELRAILSFTDAGNMPLSTHFEVPGKPIVFCINSDPSFEGTFVLATLADTGSSHIGGASQAASQRSSYRPNQSHAASQRITSRPSTSARPLPSATRGNTSRASTSNSRVSTSNSSISSKNQHRFQSKSRAGPGKEKSASLANRMENACSSLLRVEPEPPNPDQSQNVQPNGSMHNSNGDRTNNNKDTRSDKTVKSSNRSNVDEKEAASSESPVIPVQPASSRLLGAGDSPPQEEDEDDDLVPDSPPAKKFKSLFFGLSQSTQGSQPTSSKKPTVLAEDTDEDD